MVINIRCSGCGRWVYTSQDICSHCGTEVEKMINIKCGRSKIEERQELMWSVLSLLLVVIGLGLDFVYIVNITFALTSTLALSIVGIIIGIIINRNPETTSSLCIFSIALGLVNILISVTIFIALV